MPFHVGHKLMIDFGLSMMDHMFVLIDGLNSDEIDVRLRTKWLKDHYKNETNIKIIHIKEHVPSENLKMDEFGTMIDEEFWAKWSYIFKKYAPDATHFVSSDMYGKEAAKRLNIKWLPVDIQRETYSISGTMIRKNPLAFISYMVPEAQADFRKVIAIIGPESTGKSTLVKNMATQWDCVGVHEYGRTITIANDNNFSDDDFFLITKGQDVLIELAKKNGHNEFVFTDTEAYVTYLYGKLYRNQDFTAIREFAREQNIDHYIVMAPTVPWVDDGLRVQPDQEGRVQFYDDLILLLKEDGKSYSEVFDNDYDSRSKAVETILDGFLRSIIL
jgi:HTH-type transcriptional repressor of NAD biosynthesis genes